MSKSSFSSLHMYFGGGNCQHPLVCLWAAKNSVLKILDPPLRFFFFFFLFVIRITYQCLRKDLAKIVHGKCLYASMASSAMTERSNANTLFSHHFIYYHVTSKLVKGVWINIRKDLEVIFKGI